MARLIDGDLKEISVVLSGPAADIGAGKFRIQVKLHEIIRKSVNDASCLIAVLLFVKLLFCLFNNAQVQRGILFVCGFPGLLHHRQQQPGEHGHGCDYRNKFEQRESGLILLIAQNVLPVIRHDFLLNRFVFFGL